MLALQLRTNGGSKISFRFLLRRFTTVAAAEPQSHSFENYLIKSLGFSKQEAHSTSKKVRNKSPRNDPNIVVNYLQKLGLSKTQIKSIVSSSPKLLSYDVDKTLKPKVEIFQDLGLKGSELVKFLATFKTLLRRGLDSEIKPPVECLRELFGSDDKVVEAFKKCPFLLHYYAYHKIKPNVLVLRNNGFSDEKIVKLILENPMRISLRSPERTQEILDQVENEIGIPRDSKMFYFGFMFFSKLSKSAIDGKFGVFRSFGWSDPTIYSMVRKSPSTIGISEAKLRNSLNFFMGELGYTADYLASHSGVFSMNLEKRVRPRHEVWKILNEKKLNNTKASLYTVLIMLESKFLAKYLLPYKDKIPQVYQSYIKKQEDR